MGIVAFTAGASPPVFGAVYGNHGISGTARVVELLMTPEAQLPGVIDGQGPYVIGMTHGGAVAVFALDILVDVAVIRLDLFRMALATRLHAKVLDGKFLPFADIVQPVEAVCEVTAMDAKVIRDEEHPGYENQDNEGNGYPEWVEHMSFHPQPSRNRCQSAVWLPDICLTTDSVLLGLTP